eukprot:1156672-Pelagomonas_calceolata.AAC.3
MAASLSQPDSDKRLNLSTGAEAALKPCIAGTYPVKACANNCNLTNWLHALLAFENIYYPSRIACQPDMGHSLLQARHRNG